MKCVSGSVSSPEHYAKDPNTHVLVVSCAKLATNSPACHNIPPGTRFGRMLTGVERPVPSRHAFWAPRFASASSAFHEHFLCFCGNSLLGAGILSAAVDAPLAVSYPIFFCRKKPPLNSPPLVTTLISTTKTSSPNQEKSLSFSVSFFCV